MIIVVGDTPSSVEINAGEGIGDPSKMAAAQYSVSPWGVYLYMSMPLDASSIKGAEQEHIRGF